MGNEPFERPSRPGDYATDNGCTVTALRQILAELEAAGYGTSPVIGWGDNPDEFYDLLRVVLLDGTVRIRCWGGGSEE